MDHSFYETTIGENIGMCMKWIVLYKLLNTRKTPKTPINSLIDQKQISVSDNNGFQVVLKPITTKNKNTNNKKTKIITNLHINVEKLEDLIDEVQLASEENDKSKSISNLYDFLIVNIPKFKGFKMSQEDYNLIDDIRSYTTFCTSIANRIIRNAEAIINNRMESRFGNLFVGLNEIDRDVRLKYGF